MIPCKTCIVYARCNVKQDISCKILGKWLRDQIRIGRYTEAKDEIQLAFSQFVVTTSNSNGIRKITGMEIHLKMNNELKVKSK